MFTHPVELEARRLGASPMPLCGFEVAEMRRPLRVPDWARRLGIMAAQAVVIGAASYAGLVIAAVAMVRR